MDISRLLVSSLTRLIPLLNQLACAKNLRKAIYIFLFLLLPIQNWGQEISFDEAILCVQSKGYFERLMLKKGASFVKQTHWKKYGFPIIINDETIKIFGHDLEDYGKGIGIYQYLDDNEFSWYIESEKKVIVNDYRDTLKTEFLQKFDFRRLTYASNYSVINETANTFYELHDSEFTQLFGLHKRLMGGGTNMFVTFFDNESWIWWVNQIEKKAEFIELRNSDYEKNEAKYEYRYQDIEIILSQRIEGEDSHFYYEIEFIKPEK